MKTWLPRLFVALFLLFLIGCHSTTISKWQQLEIKLIRSGCIWMCPEYVLTVSGDGTVVYQGSKYVANAGERRTRISEEQVRLLVSEFEKVDFNALSDKYERQQMTDQETVITSITVDGRTKTVKHYHGDFDAPKSLAVLEKKIDEVVQSSQWVK